MVKSSADMRDMGMTLPVCDPTAQNCADPNQKCIVTVSMGKVTGGCVANGTVAEGGTCMRAMMGVPDNCQKGLTCARVGGGGGGGGTSVCRKIGKADSTCGAQKCIISGGGGGGGGQTTYGSCSPTCNLFSTDCGTGQTCASFATGIGSTQMNPIYVPICRATGNVAAYGTCQRSSDCVADTACNGQGQTGRCFPLCSDTVACTQPAVDGGGYMCTPLGGLANNAGICG